MVKKVYEIQDSIFMYKNINGAYDDILAPLLDSIEDAMTDRQTFYDYVIDGDITNAHKVVLNFVKYELGYRVVYLQNKTYRIAWYQSDLAMNNHKDMKDSTPMPSTSLSDKDEIFNKLKNNLDARNSMYYYDDFDDEGFSLMFDDLDDTSDVDEFFNVDEKMSDFYDSASSMYYDDFDALSI